MRKKLQAKYMLLETRKDGTKFTNRPMKEAAELLQNLAGQYDDMQKQLVEQVRISLSLLTVGKLSLGFFLEDCENHFAAQHLKVNDVIMTKY